MSASTADHEVASRSALPSAPDRTPEEFRYPLRIKETQRPGSHLPPAAAKLSPFDVPTSIKVDVFPDDVCVFRFDYKNREPAEDRWRRASTEDSIEVLLGRHTRKILAVRVSNARSCLSGGCIPFSYRVIPDWAADLPLDAVRACERNAEVVRALLDGLRDTFRASIVRALDTTIRGA